MAEKPTKGEKQKAKSQDSKAKESSKPQPFWSAKRVSLWLAGPTAVLVFLNEAATVKQLFSTSNSPKNSEVKVVLEHKDPNSEGVDPKAPPLSIETARFDEQDPNKLDIVCRNSSAQSAFVKAAEVELVKVWKLQPVVASRGPLASSANYDLTLPASSEPTKFDKELIQEIQPKSLDRFSITLGAAPSKEASAKVYLFRLTLLCGAQSVPAGEFLYMIPPSSGSPQPMYAANKKAVEEMQKSKAKRNTLLTKFLASAPVE